MSSPIVLRWPLPAEADGRFACPTCGAGSGLILAMDLDDRSEDPSYMSCPVGHVWPEDRFPRRLAAELLDDMLQLDPTLLGRLDELQALQERREP